MTATGSAAAFREAVLDDGQPTMRLRRPRDRGTVVERVVQAGTSRGFASGEAGVLTALRDGWAVWRAPGAETPVPAAGRLVGWTPFRASFGGERMPLDRCHLGDLRPTEPGHAPDRAGVSRVRAVAEARVGPAMVAVLRAP